MAKRKETEFLKVRELATKLLEQNVEFPADLIKDILRMTDKEFNSRRNLQKIYNTLKRLDK